MASFLFLMRNNSDTILKNNPDPISVIIKNFLTKPLLIVLNTKHQTKNNAILSDNKYKNK